MFSVAMQKDAMRRILPRQLKLRSHIKSAMICRLQSRCFWQILVVFFSVLYPRLANMGAFPYMDEGFYVWQSMHIGRHILYYHTLPAEGSLALYPLLLAWLSWLPGNSIIWYRFVDMLVATSAAWLFCKILRRESADSWCALAIAFAALCCMNLEPVINAGFKNSFFAAYIPLFTAMWLCEARGKRRWTSIGACVALAVLLRETFAPFAVLGLCAIIIAYGIQPAARYCLGGILAALLMVGAVCIARGNWNEVVLAYTQATGVYAVQSGQVLKKFMENGGRALEFFSPVLLIAAVSCIYRHAYAGKTHQLHVRCFTRQSFWLFAAFLPLLEPASKIGFMYHFSVCLPGLAGYAACNFKYFSWLRMSRAKKIIWFFVLISSVACFLMLPSPNKFWNSLRMLPDLCGGFTQESHAENSNTLLAAKIIEHNLPLGGSLAISGFTHFLYGACKAMPPLHGPFAKGDIYQLSDLARSYRALGQDSHKLASALMQNPPDVLAIANAINEHEPDFYEGVLKAVEESAQYALVGIVAPDKDKNYGWVGYHIFKRRPAHGPGG